MLSVELGLPFHDWADMMPFYHRKFLSVGRDAAPGEMQIAASRELFNVAFPDLALRSKESLMKTLRDKRVHELRRLVEDAAQGKVVFDGEFARRILSEVWGAERRIAKYRNVLSYVTMPMNFLPGLGGLAGTVGEEIIGAVIAAKLRQRFRWFYMLSDVAEGRVDPTTG